MPTTISRTTYDNSIVVPVIASFDNDGHILPLYVRIDGEPYKIRSAWLKPSFSSCFIFHCQIEDAGVIKHLMLTYHQQESVWTIPKS